MLIDNYGFNPLTPTGNGVWVFTTMLAPGAPYSVTVSQQPTNPFQECLVMNGAGTVASANVIVQVTCTNTYAIGGNISGVMAGTGTLRLTPNGTVMLVNGPFRFSLPSERVPTGQQYNVTVAINPLNQTCTVMNGTGTVANADVTNVTVVCTSNTNTYTVGGTVSGLMGSVLALSLNDAGSPPFSPMMNGSFTFPTQLANGQPYNVTVATQPPAPNPYCRVINGAGTVMNMNVTNVTVDCMGCVQAGMPCIQGMPPCCMGSCVMTPTMGSRCQ